MPLRSVITSSSGRGSSIEASPRSAVVLSMAHQYNLPHALRPLRMLDRPRRCRAAEKRDEFVPPHELTTPYTLSVSIVHHSKVCR
jgi:hypothetical protein